VAAGASVNRVSRLGTALHSAFLLDHTEVTRWLLQQRTIDVNQKDAQDCTLLLCACEEGSAETVSLLLEHPDVDVTHTTADVDGGWTTNLHMAVFAGHAECVSLLLRHAVVDANQTASDGRTPLHIACQEGRAGCARLLLSLPSIAVNLAEDADGATALYAACVGGELECVQLLLAHPDIRVNQQTTEDLWTPLLVAAHGGHADCVQADQCRSPLYCCHR
jgi:ankyrin repeat protein